MYDDLARHYDDLEEHIVINDIDIFETEYYLEECELEFIVKRALKTVEKDPNRIGEIMDKIAAYTTYSDQEILRKFDKYREQFYKHICKENFLITKNNDKALKYLPHLYLISLKNNYKYTINHKCYAYLPNPEIYNEMIIEDDKMAREYYFTLAKNGYAISQDVEHPLFVSPLMFLASLTNDRIKTYASCGLLFYFYPESVKKFIYKKGFKELYKEQPNLLPQFIIENRFVLEELLRNEEKVNMAVRIFSREDYNTLIEKEVLRIFNVKYPNIESYVRALCKTEPKKTRKTLTVEEKILMTFFTKKLLYKLGVRNYKVDMFAYSTNSLEDKEARGQIAAETLQVFTTTKDDDLKEVLFTIIHEAMHAKQNLAIRSIDFSLDRDIDMYARDHILGEIFNEKYYKQNYSYISYEQDANFKTEIRLAKLLKEFDKLFEEYKVLGEKELLKNKDYINKVRKDSGANLTMYRIFDDKKYCLDDLFEELTTRYLRSGGNLEALFKKSPVAYYAFSIEDDNRVRIRGVKELAIRASTSLGKDREIYLNLIKQRLDEKKNVNYLEAREELEACASYQDYEVRDAIEKMLSKKHSRLTKYTNPRNI